MRKYEKKTQAAKYIIMLILYIAAILGIFMGSVGWLIGFAFIGLDIGSEQFQGIWFLVCALSFLGLLIALIGSLE